MKLFIVAITFNYINFPGPEGKKCSVDVQLNEQGQEFTCEFSTSSVGEHSIEIVVGEKRLDNVTSKFYTYDASKINVGSIPPGFVGMPIEFESKYDVFNLIKIIFIKEIQLRLQSNI